MISQSSSHLRAPESAQDTDIIKISPRLQECLILEGVQLNCGKSQGLLAGGFTLDGLSETQREEMANMQLKIVRPRMRVVGIPVGTKAL